MDLDAFDIVQSRNEDDPAIANIFYQEWYKRYIESGGAPLAGVGPGGAAKL